MNIEQEFAQYAHVVKLLATIEDIDVVDPIKAVSAGKAAIDMVKLLQAYGEEVQDVKKHGEFMRTIGELSLQIAELNLKVGDQIEQIKALQDEVKELRTPEVKLVRKKGLYYDSEDETYPYCPRCFTAEKKLNQLSVIDAGMGMKAFECICGWSDAVV